MGGGLDDRPPLLTPVTVQSVALHADSDTSKGSSIVFEIRSGPTPVYDAVSWTDWQPLTSAIPNGSRYMQWKATLSSPDPLKTPSLRSVAVESKVAKLSLPAWAGNLRAGDFHNEDIRYTSMPDRSRAQRPLSSSRLPAICSSACRSASPTSKPWHCCGRCTTSSIWLPSPRARSARLSPVG